MADAMEQIPAYPPQSGITYLYVLGTVSGVTIDTLTAEGQPMRTADHTPAQHQWYSVELWPHWMNGTGGPLPVMGSTISALSLANTGPDLTTHTQVGATFRLSDDRKDAFTSTPLVLELTRSLPPRMSWTLR
jgi:hypothetical protein